MRGVFGRRVIRALVVRSFILAVTLTPIGAVQAEDGNSSSPPEISVGEDAYLQWDRWPYQRIGSRAYMRSTYDRAGGNENADASHYLYQLEGDINVPLDTMGRGYLYFARYNHWHGSPWHYEVDGKDFIVQESTTADPTKKLKDAKFLPEAAFPSQLTYTYATTKGADLMWVPIGFTDRFRMGYERTFYGTGYYIYHLYAPDAPLSQPIVAWNDQSVPNQQVLDLLRSAGTDIAPMDTGDNDDIKTYQKLIPALSARKVVEPFNISDRATIRAIQLSAPRADALALGRATLRITWDGRQEPSVDVPLNLFFGAGTLHNKHDAEFLVKSLPVSIRFDAEQVHLACYFPMPFFESARIELVGADADDIEDISISVRTQKFTAPANHVGYFHATYRDHGVAQMGMDLVLLDTEMVEGGGPWSGSFVGTSFTFSDRANLRTLEGDPRFLFDDAQTPQAWGTGTEEWGGGGDYWGGKTMTLPLVGHPVGVRTAVQAKNDEELIQSAYRYLLADLMPFGHRAVIRLEHGGENESTEHYRTVTYWYGAPFATLVKTDTVDVGDPASEAEHGYHSPDASRPYKITSRFEVGPDKYNRNGDSPLEFPTHFAEFEFEAKGGVDYNIWLLGRGIDSNIRTDASWLQFDELVGHKISHSGHGDKGFGNWLDDSKPGEWSWSSRLPRSNPAKIKFARSGMHRLRLQTRHGTHELAAVWLSRSQQKRPKASSHGPAVGDLDEILLEMTDATHLQGGVQLVERDGMSVLSVGPDDGGQVEVTNIYRPTTKTGRTTKTFSEFSLNLEENNWGVMLRRTLDYQFPNQRAKVFVADASDHEPKWQEAGVWYVAGSNTCYHSYPGRSGKDRYRDRARGELASSAPDVQTSNRRLRDDEFLVSHKLTRGRDRIRVRVEFEPMNIPLLPGMEVADQAWSEIAYDCYCYVLPDE